MDLPQRMFHSWQQKLLLNNITTKAVREVEEISQLLGSCNNFGITVSADGSWEKRVFKS